MARQSLRETHNPAQVSAITQNQPAVCESKPAIPFTGSESTLDPKPAISHTGFQSAAESKPAIVHTGSPAGRKSMCEGWRAQIEPGVQAGLSAQRIYQDLVIEHQFAGS